MPNCFVDESIKHPDKVIKKLNKGSLIKGYYIVSLNKDTGKLEIISSRMFLQKYFKEREYNVSALLKSKEDAFEYIRCLSELSQKVEDVLANQQITSNKKATFMAEMQQLIDKINKENLSPTDTKWNDYEQEVLGSYTRALMGEKQENNLGEIFATILLNQFSHLLNPTDANELREGLLRIKNSKDAFERDSLRNNL